MGNHAYKRDKAIEFNANRKYRLEQEEKRRLDKLNNPEKYRQSRRATRKAKMLLAVAAGMGVNSF